jgi:hypothetical protein
LIVGKAPYEEEFARMSKQSTELKFTGLTYPEEIEIS